MVITVMCRSIVYILTLPLLLPLLTGTLRKFPELVYCPEMSNFYICSHNISFKVVPLSRNIVLQTFVMILEVFLETVFRYMCQCSYHFCGDSLSTCNCCPFRTLFSHGSKKKNQVVTSLGNVMDSPRPSHCAEETSWLVSITNTFNVSEGELYSKPQNVMFAHFVADVFKDDESAMRRNKQTANT
jgi:hypothetical protein